jgi:outer membrane protein assembly factor BamD (BamD/ComL family)
MNRWPLLSLILIAGPSSLCAQGVAELERKATAALADGLWEIAELHFKECLQQKDLTREEKSRFALRLAESLVREGNTREALELLEQSFVATHPEAPFWRAQALASEGQFNAASELLGQYLEAPESPHRAEAGLTRASLQLSLGLADEALATLSQLLPAADPSAAAKIQLYQVEILLDLGRSAEARKALPAVESLPPSSQPLATLLEARLLLDENQPAEAQTQLDTLLSQDQALTRYHYHTAAILLADAIHGTAGAEAASKSLLQFIEKNPTSPLLDAMFRRITLWLPEKPTATDPVLERVAQWLPEKFAATDAAQDPMPWLSPLATVEGPGTVSAWPNEPSTSKKPEREIHSIYTYAIGLHRMGTVEKQAQANRLLHHLRLAAPSHPLFGFSLFQQARWSLDAGDLDQAFSLLETIRYNSPSPGLKGKATFLEARTTYLQGQPERAIALFEEAASSLAAPQARLATLQAAIARLRSGDLKGTTLIQQTSAAHDDALEADLQLERALATLPATADRTAIDEFLSRFPTHPRANEARLAAAEAALTGPQADLAYARDQLETLDSLPDSLDELPAAKVAAAKLRLLDLTGDSTTAAAAQDLIDTFPGSPQAAEAALTLGRSLFQAGNYNPARLVLAKLALSDTDEARAQAAWLLAARAAALVGTPQSKEDALELFDKAIQLNAPLTPLAILEKSRHLIDLSRRDEATRLLERWIAKLPATDPLQLPSGILLGEALFAEGSTNPQSLEKALAVYDKLRIHAKEHPALLARLQYLRGLTLERLPDSSDPTKTREKEAFQAYHSVLESDSPPPEWEYFELCGRRALALLEKAGRWKAAITVARKIASFKGPQAEKFAADASRIQLEQMIYEDP